MQRLKRIETKMALVGKLKVYTGNPEDGEFRVFKFLLRFFIHKSPEIVADLI